MDKTAEQLAFENRTRDIRNDALLGTLQSGDGAGILALPFVAAGAFLGEFGADLLFAGEEEQRIENFRKSASLEATAARNRKALARQRGIRLLSDLQLSGFVNTSRSRSIGFVL